jgi:hypothetical protein
MNHLLRAAALGGLILGLGSGCNTAAKINAPKIYFYNAQVVGAVPVYKNGDAYERLCRTSELPAGASLEGLAVDLELISTERKEQNETVFDNDKSIQVGDYINRHYVEAVDVSAENVTFSVDCVKQVGPTLVRECEAATDIGAGTSKVNSQIVDVSHVQYADRATTWGNQGSGPGIGVVVLVDQSGSVSGFVQPDPNVAPPDGKPDRYYEMSYDDANMAITKWQQEHGDTTVLEKLASDKKQIRRTALDDFISGLNKNDKLLVMSYNEDETNHLVCSGAELENPTMADCFATRRDWVARGMNDLAGNEGGRTPLWESLYGAVEFLQDQAGMTAKHIVVLNDGPDTCNPASEHFVGGTICGAKSFDDVKGLLETGTSDVPVHVHFVQYQAKGYPERDQAQVELACLTEGTYSFVNRGDLGTTEFQDALIAALDRARFGFLGKWRMIIQSDVVAANLPWSQGTPPGHAYGVRGFIKLLQSAFVRTEFIVSFKVGSQSNADSVKDTPNWDNTLVFRKDCVLDSQCSGDDNAACVSRCGWETGLCAAVDLPDPTGQSCTLDGGIGGVCCKGTCQDVTATCE